MLKLVDLTYRTNFKLSDPLQLVKEQKQSLGYVTWIKNSLDVGVVKHMSHKHLLVIDDIRYNIFKGRNRFGYFSLKTFRYLKEQQPDVILVQGLSFPLQVIFMRSYLGKRPVIILQHHGENPYTWPKRLLQRIADKDINAYLFTSLDNAKDWINSKVISSAYKCFEIQAGSTTFSKRDKEESRIRCGFTGPCNFLWVGRLNANKDPLTVLSAFEKYLNIYPAVKLYMIYQTEELLIPVQNMINRSQKLKDAIVLKGKIDNEELVHWYSAADFYISGSHKESCGFALIEAMACGCVPVVTDIPSFRKITAGGEYAFLYEAGNQESLFNVLKRLNTIAAEKMSLSITGHFKKELSFKTIAENLYSLCRQLTGK